MFEPQPKKTFREIVRDTLTPSRVGLLSWAFAAVIMGTVGLASYQFGSRTVIHSPSRLAIPGLPLPSGGDVTTTASIGSASKSLPVEIMQMPRSGNTASDSELTESQIEVLQREIIGLRRRLSALSEQNLTYSRRIAVLEEQVAAAGLAGNASDGAAEAKPALEPAPGVIITEPAPEAAEQQTKAPPVPVSKVPPSGDVQKDSQPENPAPVPRVRTQAQEPVRIVELPEPEGEPQATGSIPPQGSGPDQGPEAFAATPTSTTSKPTMIAPSDAVGRLHGSSGENQLKRSDFGAVIGRYGTSAAAAKAWADFKEQNEERMGDLRPLLLQRTAPEGGIALMVGPFGNAADAALACLQLLDVTELCHPAIFAGDPLISAAKFRDSAF